MFITSTSRMCLAAMFRRQPSFSGLCRRFGLVSFKDFPTVQAWVFGFPVALSLARVGGDSDSACHDFTSLIAELKGC